MAAADRRLSLTLAAGRAFGCSVLVFSMLGCASDGGRNFDATRPTRAKAEIEQTKQAAESEPVPAAPVSEAPEAAPPVADLAPDPAPDSAPDPTQPVTTRPGVIQFETARVDDESEPPELSLFEAAAAERRRREHAAPAQIVITDANLSDFSEVGQLTEFSSENGAEVDDTPATNTDEVDQEALWRSRARNARLAWRAAADRISELEERVAALRYEFYSEDDPYHRDSVTKPAWDRAAIDLEQARFRVEEVRLLLNRVLEEGYAAGALPGWLREGLEFEPPATPRDDRNRELETAEPIEPPIAEDPPK